MWSIGVVPWVSGQFNRHVAICWMMLYSYQLTDTKFCVTRKSAVNPPYHCNVYIITHLRQWHCIFTFTCSSGTSFTTHAILRNATIISHFWSQSWTCTVRFSTQCEINCEYACFWHSQHNKTVFQYQDGAHINCQWHYRILSSHPYTIPRHPNSNPYTEI